MPKFPKTLFVTCNELSDKSGRWYQPHTDQIEAIERDDKIGDQVATYQLVKVARLKITKTIEVVK